MPFKHVLLSICTIPLLIACSSDEDSVEYELSLEAVIVNSCGIETPATSQDVMLLVHNDDFSTNNSAHPDNNGNVNLAIDTETVTYSIVSAPKELSNADISINTYVDSKVHDIGQIRIDSSNTEGCDCTTVTSTIEMPETDTTGINVGEGFTEYELLTGSSNSIQGEHCVNPTGDNLPIIIIADYEDSQFVSYEKNYQPNQTIDVEHQGMSPSFSLETVDDSPATILAFSFTNEFPVAFSFSTSNRDGEGLYLYDFEDIVGHRLSFHHTMSLDSDLGFIELNTNKSLYSSSIIENQQISLTNIMELSSFNEDNFSYSFPVGEGFDSAFFRLSLNVGDDTIAWRINTPLTGQLPNLENFSLENFTLTPLFALTPNSISVQFGVEGYTQTISSYDDFLRKVQRPYSPSDSLTLGAYISSSLWFDIDDFNELLNATSKPAIASVIKSSDI